ncbi:MAG: hypothetical protein U0271_13455 [Polyangiaceae bacterium]
MNRALAVVMLVNVCACGGSKEDANHAGNDASASASTSTTAPPEVVESPPKTQITRTANDDVARPRTLSDGSKLLEGLFKTGERGFPKPKFTDIDCTGAVGLTGNGSKDYDALADACGAGTGMRAITMKVTGTLDAKSHPHEVYAFTMLGRLCYRAFLVGDETLTTMNVRVERPNGALLAVMTGKHGVVLVEPQDLWCADSDDEYRLVLSATGTATGNYAFGIWARPEPGNGGSASAPGANPGPR